MLKRNLKQASKTVKSQAYKTIVHADLNFNMHQPSGTHIRQKIHTTLTKYKTMQQDGTIMTTHTTQVSLPYKNN